MGVAHDAKHSSEPICQFSQTGNVLHPALHSHAYVAPQQVTVQVKMANGSFVTAKMPMGRLESVAQPQPLWLPGGWVMTEVAYDCREGNKKDAMYYHAPTGSKVRSRPELFRHVAVLRAAGKRRTQAKVSCCMSVDVRQNNQCQYDLSSTSYSNRR